MKKIISFILLAVYFLYTEASDFTVQFNRINFSESLPNTIIKRLFQDKDGYIWIGTESGIGRYDGYKLITIKSTAQNPTLLTSGNILCIEQDKDGHIWFGTDRGVNILDENRKIIPLFTGSLIQNLRINSILSDSKGDVWIGSENGLFRYTPSTKAIRKYVHNNNPTSISGNNVNQVFEDNFGTIWIALWGDGLCRFDRQNETFTQMPRLGKKNTPYCIIQDKDNALWVGTWMDGLFQIKFSGTSKIPQYTQYRTDRNKPQSISDNFIFSIIQDDVTGSIWIMSQMGVNLIRDKENVSFEQVNTTDQFGSASHSFNQIIKDREGNIWIGTSDDGIYFASLNNHQVESNTLAELTQNKRKVTVKTFFERDEKLWLGLSRDGICVYDQKTNRIDTSSQIARMFQRITNSIGSTVNCFAYNTSEESIWIGGSIEDSNLLIVTNTPSGYKIESFYSKFNIDPEKTNSITALYCDSKKRIWMGTRNGIFLWSDQKLIPVLPKIHNARAIVEAKNGDIWIGSTNVGVIKLSQSARDKFVSTHYSVSNKNINSNEINTLYIDSRGELWAGCNNGGLNKYNPQNNVFDCENKNYSIYNEDVYSIIEDNNKNLWFTTSSKIYQIKTDEKKSMSLSVDYNIQTNTFKPGSQHIDSNGKLYFGGSNGFYSFYPQIEEKTQTPCSVIITDIEIENQSIFASEKAAAFNWADHILELKYNERNIGFEFSVLNYTTPNNIKYAYKLDGIDKEWVYVDSKRRFANYNSLSKGEYEFRIKATNEYGVWNDEETLVKIIVSPSPFETWWAICIYILTALAAGYMAFRIITNRINLKQKLLISQLNHKKSEELVQIKLKYFTNISHELLTPLTIISCLIDDFNQKFPDQYKHYKVLVENVTRLKRLLKQILDFRKVESGKMELRVSQGNLVDFISESGYDSFVPIANKKGIEFEVIAPDEIIGWFDKDIIDKAVFNVLSNAMKYTSTDGFVNIIIKKLNINCIRYAQIEISDSGSGIAPESLPYIFDRFYISPMKNTESNGVGLSLSKDLIELHKGSITVVSQLGEGSSFTIQIPIDENVYSESEKDEAGNGTKNNWIDCENEDLPVNESEQACPEPTKDNETTILVVEDNEDLRHIIAESLSRYYNTLTAKHGVEALSIIKENDITLVVSDVLMPEMDGISLCKIIKQDKDLSHIPIILITAKNQIMDRVECYNAGADGYISKPFEIKVLKAKIDNLITSRREKYIEYVKTIIINSKNIAESNSLDEIFLRKAVLIVEKNLANFNADSLMEEMNSSRSTLYRKIKSLTGLSPSSFIREIRLKHACLMLENGNESIAQIAYAVGFNDPKYFSTCFKEKFEISPREYIKLKKR